MFVGEAMLIEVDFHQRLEQSQSSLGHYCDAVLGDGSVREKKENRGTLGKGGDFAGPHVGIETKRTRLPDANIEGAKFTISQPRFNSGNTVALLKTRQELRCLFAHYDSCSKVGGEYGATY